jgi:acetolactate synthase-1/2/3 large subunit
MRHELSAALAADGFGKISGRPGVSIVTSGPGATNGLSGVVHAYSAGSPMIYISGTTPKRERTFPFHGTDDPEFLEKVFEPITKKVIRVEKPDSTIEAIESAYQISLSGRKGPVYVSLPYDVLEKQTDCRQVRKREEKQLACARATKGVALALLNHETKVVLVLGESLGSHPELRQRLVKLAERINSPVLTHSSAIGIFPSNHPLYSGSQYSDSYLSPLAAELVKDADLVMYLGYLPEQVEVKELQKLNSNEPLIITLETGLEDDSILMEEAYPAVTYVLENLIQKADWAKDRIRDYWNSYEQHLEKEATHYSHLKPIHPSFLSHAISKHLDDDDKIVGDIGMGVEWILKYLPRGKDIRYLNPGTYGAMGYAIPAAIGVRMGSAEGRVFAATGDGGMLMNIMELQTLSREDIDVKVIVYNDGRYGVIERLHRVKFNTERSYCLGKTDFQMIASSLGLRAFRADDPKEFLKTVEEFASTKSPALLDVVTRSVRSEGFR